MAARLLRALGRGVLWASAVLGVALAAVAAFSASSFGRPVVAGLLVAQADAAVAGRITLQGVEVLPQGGLSLRGLEVYSPEGQLVLQVSRARLFADLTRLRSRVVGVVLDLEHPSVLLESEPGGTVSLARAFAPATPAPAAPAGRAGPERPSWTLRLTRLTLRGGDVWWQDERGVTTLEASGVDLDAEASFGPEGGFLELVGRGELAAPAEGASTLALAAHLDGDALTVPVLDVAVGATRLTGLGQADLARRSFRAAVTRLGVTPRGLAPLAPAARLGGELTGTLYAESDGALATAALAVAPVDARGAAAPGRAGAAVAARLPPAALALGFEVDAAGIDPARLVAQAPPGRVTLTARGAAAGPWTPGELRGRLDLSLAPSRLRGGELGPVAVRAAADRGAVTVDRLDAVLPGLAAGGSGRWRAQGAVAGTLRLDAPDLALAGRNLEALGAPGLPALGGRARLQATLSGTTAAPALRGSLEAPQARAGDLRVEGARLEVEAAGPLATARGRVSGAVRRLLAGATEARALTLEAGLAGEEAALSASAVVPGLGTDPVSLQAGALLSDGRRTATLRELSLAWPGTRYALAQPARLTLAAPPGAPPAGPSVDRLELADGPRRLVLAGGLGPAGALDATVEVRRLDLARLPRGLVPADLGLAGLLDATARATGTPARPRVVARLALADGAARGLDGLSLGADATWDGAGRRLTGDARLARAGGGTLEVAADLPLPLRPAPGRGGARAEAPLSLTATAAGWPVAALRRAAGAAAPLDGTAGARLRLAGTQHDPTLAASASLADATWDDLGPFGATASLEGAGGAARLSLDSTHAGGRLLSATVTVPLDVADLLDRPGPVARALATAPLTAAVDLPGADLAPFAGRAGLPEGLAGTLTGTAALTGSAAAPRGTVALSLRDGAAAGYREVGAAVEAVLEAGRTAVTGRATLGREEALRLTGSLAVPPEGLADRAALRRAALALDAVVPPLSLEQAAAPAAAATGQVAAHLAVQGTLAAPAATLDLDAASVTVEGRPLGDLTATARAGAAGASAELAFRATTGGALRAAGTLDAALGLDADPAALRRAPARLRVTSEALDLGFLPALLPGLVRAASGRLDVEATAAGPLAELAPRGTLTLAGGRLAVTEYGEWTDLALEVRLTDHALAVPVLSARRGGGTLSGSLSLEDAGQARARLAGKATFSRFTLARAGMDLATLDLGAELAGTVSPTGADVTVTVTPGTVRLPRKIPRTLQSLERRSDIVVGRPAARRHAPALPGSGGQPFDARLRLVIPARVFVKSDSPRVDVEIKGDTTWHLDAGELRAEGSLEVVRGTVEPITGRLFVLDRGKVQFTGGGYGAGLLDVVARYENPAAVVTAAIGGTVDAPAARLSSQPVLDDAAIAMLIATGRTELKAGTSEVGTLTGKDAGLSVAGALLVNFARDFISDKLPVDTFSVASDSLRTGKYLSDKLYVGYTRRFEARPEKGENPDEVRVEYQISPRWQLESRYGSAQSGGASLIWTRDY